MTDRELLEMAAKAAAIELGWDAMGAYQVLPGVSGSDVRWNPLEPGIEALRLMATLNINVYYRENINGAFVIAERTGIDFCPESLDGPHEDVATCRAIVRAAAEVGKTMP